MNKELADDFLKALVSAYVWVASADEGVSLIELHKYEQAMMQSQFVTQFEPNDMRIYFKDMVALFLDNYDTAVELTKNRLKQIANQDHLVEEVIRICRAAAVSDSKLKDSEETILNDIAQALALQKNI